MNLLLRHLATVMFLSSLSQAAFANVEYSELSCEDKGVRSAQLQTVGNNYRFTFKANNDTLSPLLRYIFPNQPATLMRAYRCVEISSLFPKQNCQSDIGNENYLSCYTEKTTVTVRAKLSCYDRESEWDNYTAKLDALGVNASVEHRPIYAVSLPVTFDVKVAKKSPLQFSGDRFDLERWRHAGGPTIPSECTVDGEEILYQ